MKRLIFFAIILIAASCETDIEEPSFCKIVGESEKEIQAMNDSDAENIRQLKQWLKRKPCIGDVTIICQDCLKSLPAKGRIAINFKSLQIGKIAVIRVEPFKVLYYE